MNTIARKRPRTTRREPSAQLPSEFRGPVVWLEDVGGGFGVRTNAGTTINAESMMTLSGVFAAVRAIAEDVAKLPLNLYRQLQPRGRQIQAGELNDLVSVEPNEEMPAYDFREALMANALLWHGGFAEIMRDNGGNPVSLELIYPSRVWPKRDDGGKLYYEITEGAERRIVQPRDMIHIHGFGVNGIVGMAMKDYGAQAFGIYMAAEMFSGSFFANGAISTGIIRLKGKASSDAINNFRSQFQRRYSGSENSFLPIVLTSDVEEYKPDSIDPEKGQMVEYLEFRINDVARWFRIPPHLTLIHI